MWRDMEPRLLFKKVLLLFMAVIVNITIFKRSLRIEAHHRNQPNNTKLMLYKSLLLYLFTRNKINKCFSYKGGCGICGF